MVGSKIDFYDKSILGVSEYWEKTPKSREYHCKAKNWLPGGDTRYVTYFKPYPAVMERGEGCRLYDVDGNILVDFINNYSSQILGHAHPSVVKSVQDRFTNGNGFAATTKECYKLAEMLCKRIPSIEKIRFTNSGTEATMFAIRAARVFTGKDKILKVEGGYHGTHNCAQISVKPSLDKAGSPEAPKSVPENRGIPYSAVRDVLVAPFNDPEGTKKLIEENKDDLAAFIIEPIMHAAGIIPARKDYLKHVREVTEDAGVLLIFDEVVTFRAAKGGAQEYYEVNPDLTCLGKMIGGGFPIGAFGGRDDIMSIFSPEKEGFIKHSGTFNANATTMAAGLATIKELTSQRISKLNSLGSMIRGEVKQAFENARIFAQVTGEFSLFQIHLTKNEVWNYRTAAMADKELIRLLHLHLYNHGIFTAPRGSCNLSTEIREREMREFGNSLEISLEEIKPYIRRFNPSLLK